MSFSAASRITSGPPPAYSHTSRKSLTAYRRQDPRHGVHVVYAMRSHTCDSGTTARRATECEGNSSTSMSTGPPNLNTPGIERSSLRLLDGLLKSGFWFPFIWLWLKRSELSVAGLTGAESGACTRPCRLQEKFGTERELNHSLPVVCVSGLINGPGNHYFTSGWGNSAYLPGL